MCFLICLKDEVKEKNCFTLKLIFPSNVAGLGISSEQRKAVVQSRISRIHMLLGVKGGILIGRMSAIIQVN